MASFAAALFTTLLALTSTSYADHIDTTSWRRSLTFNGDKVDTAFSQGPDNSGALASTLQSALVKIFVSWSSTDDTMSELDTPGTSDGPEDELDSEQQLLINLHQILDVAESLLDAPNSCKSSTGDSGDATLPSSPCPSTAPELLQGSALAFLSSLLRTYPRGPTSRQALVAWTAAATTFLQDHHHMQRQQRLSAQRAVDQHVAALAASGSWGHGTPARTTETVEAARGQGTATGGVEGRSNPEKEQPSVQPPPHDQQHHHRQQQEEEQQQQQNLRQMPQHRRQQHRRQLRTAPQNSVSGLDSDPNDPTIISTPRSGGYTGTATGEGGGHLPVGFRSREGVRHRRGSAVSSLGTGISGRRQRRALSYKNDPRDISTNTSSTSSSSGTSSNSSSSGTSSNSSSSSNSSNSSSSSNSSNSSHRVGSISPHMTHHHAAFSHSSTVHACGLPLVRRVLLAQLLLGWATDLRKELPVSPEVATGVARIFTMLYYIHVDSVVDRAALEYFHISKAGGTSWTAAAKANGCSVPRAKAARTPEFDDNCRWFDPEVLVGMGLTVLQASRTLVCPRYGIVERRSQVRDCNRRLEHFRRVGLQYTSNEYTLHGGRDDMYGTHICPQFVNVATIREPLGRLLSNLRYMMVQLKRERALPAQLFSEAFCNRSAADWELYSPPLVDNYNIRTLVGERAFHTPLYGIGEAHEAVAKQLLLQYDLVLDLNSGSHAAALLMRSGLGWNITLADVHIWTSEKLAKTGNLDFNTCPLGDIEPLLTRQGYDQRWYSFGRSLSHLDQLFLATASHLGLRPWPQDWEERQLGPPPEDGIVWAECGLIGLVPPLPLPYQSLLPISERPSNTTLGLSSPSPWPSPSPSLVRWPKAEAAAGGESEQQLQQQQQ